MAQMSIIFSTPRWRGQPFAALIRWLTKSKVSHSSIGMDLEGVPVVVQATVGGVQVTPRSKFEKKSQIVAEYVINPTATTDLEYAVDHIGDHYDYVGLLGYAVVLFAWRWFKRKIKNPLASPKALVCSEFVVCFGRQLPEWRFLDPETTTAEDLLERVSNGNSFTKLST